MARFTDETKERVKQAADIAEVVSPYTELVRRGKDLWGLCPFHEERTPSFKVNPQDKLYFCFGCQASGDVFSFVEEKEGLSFPEAVEMLAERYGVEIERESEDPRAEEARRRKARLWELLERTAKYYERYLWEAPKAEKARAYLLGRGLGEEVLRRFGVGMAPSPWDQVLTGSQLAGFKVDELLAAGLAQKGRQGGHYDRFRSRITFPIRDQRGRVLGFGARALRAESKPKYLNSPEGELYRKSNTLYGIDRARGPIAKTRRAIVVEGYTDVLALHQAGVEEAVAIMGTAITPEQLTMLAGLTDVVVLALDADRAGADAMIRAQRVAGGRDSTSGWRRCRKGRIPRTCCRRTGSIASTSWSRARSTCRASGCGPRFGRGDLGSVAGRERTLAEVAPVLAAMGEVVGRDELIREVADRLDTDPSLVSERVRSAPKESPPAAGGNGAKGAPAPAAPLTPRETRERALLAMCIADPKAGRSFIDRLSDEHVSESGAPALRWLREHLDDPMAGLPREDEELTALITELVMSSERIPALEGAMQLNLDLLEQQRLEDSISAAQEAGDYEAGARLSRERAQLTDRIAYAETLGA